MTAIERGFLLSPLAFAVMLLCADGGMQRQDPTGLMDQLMQRPGVHGFVRPGLR